MTPVLITGANGWLGVNLARAVTRGLPDVPGLGIEAAEIRLLVHTDERRAELDELRDDRVRLYWGDVTRPDTLDDFFRDAGAACLFHTAGIIHPRLRVSELEAVNATGTRNVVDLAVRAGVRRLVHVSSNSPIGCNASPDERFDESAPYHPYMEYGRTKMVAELAVKAAAEHMETVIVRPPWFYGPSQPDRQSRFFTMVRAGKFPLLGDGSNRRSMAYVDNICQGLILAATHSAAIGQTYWIADTEPYRMATVVDTVEQVLEEDFGMRVARRRRHLPSFVGDIATAADGAVQAAGLYQQELHVLGEMNKTIACSIDKARRELAFEPRVALREGMRRSVRHLLDRGVTF